MLGASRQALAEAHERLASDLATADDAVVRTTADDLLAVSALLGREPGVARALADPGAQPSARAGLVDSLVGDRIGAASLVVVHDLVSRRWSAAADLVDAVEQLGSQAVFELSAREGNLDDVEDELFRFARIVERSPELTASFTDPVVTEANRTALIQGLLSDKATSATVQLVTAVVNSLRGRTPAQALDDLAVAAAARRNYKIAVARVAVPLDDALRTRLESALATALGHEVRLQVEVDPSVVGGIVVQVGDDVFDGSVSRRIGQVTRGLT